MNRRSFVQSLIYGCAMVATAMLPTGLTLAAVLKRTDIERMRTNWRELKPDNFEAPSASDKLKLSESQWRDRLSEQEFDVLREEDTERPNSSPLDKEGRPGLFVCAGCSLPLFTSEMKFDSGTGWPSFVTSIPGAFETRRDLVLFIPRTEYHCARCGGHHGHIFDDGPEPGGERWCSNGVAMRFLPADGSEPLSSA